MSEQALSENTGHIGAVQEINRAHRSGRGFCPMPEIHNGLSLEVACLCLRFRLTGSLDKGVSLPSPEVV